MSKINKAIAALSVVASLGVAAAPMASFAAEATYDSDSHQDRLNITVLSSCTFGNTHLASADLGVTHTAGAAVTATDGGTAPSWSTTGSDGTGRTPDAAAGVNSNGAQDLAGTTGHTSDTGYEDVLTYSMYAGTTRNDLGTTTLKVYCNSNEGYTIKAQTNDLAEWNGSAAVQDGEEIPANASYSAATSGYALYSVDVDSDTTPMTVDEASLFVSSTPATIAHKETVSKDTGDKLKITYGIGVSPAQKAANYQGSVVYTLIQGYNSGS